MFDAVLLWYGGGPKILRKVPYIYAALHCTWSGSGSDSGSGYCTSDLSCSALVVAVAVAVAVGILSVCCA